MRSLRHLMSGRSIKATKYKDAALVRSHFMSGKMRKPKGSESGERNSIFSPSERPDITSSILEKTLRSMAGSGWNRPLRARRRECVYVGPHDALIQRGGFAHDMGLLLGILADVHVGGGTDDIDFDIWPILRRAKPAKHP